MSVEKEVFAGPVETAAACAKRMEAVLAERLKTAPRAAIAVSGGSTPKLLFEALQRTRLEWSRIHWFWVDERAVPPQDPNSNYRLAHVSILEPAEIPASNIHRIHGELPIAEAVENYAAEMRRFFGLVEGQIPEFDIVHLGMGDEGHTASLFPGEALIDDRTHLAAAVSAPKLPHQRVTILPGVILAARHIVMLVCGADKSWALQAVFGSIRRPMQWPAQLVMEGAGDVRWFLDRAAAQGLG